MSECYAAKECQHPVYNIVDFTPREAEEFSRALGGSAIFVSEPMPAPATKFQVTVNGKVIAEGEAPTVQAGDTLNIIFNWPVDAI